jgi:hypothetical protein
MIDPELKLYLEKIEKELSLSRAASAGAWRTIWRGCLYGAGYVIGALVIIVVVGWILNIVGVIPALNHQVTDFRDALENIGGTVR